MTHSETTGPARNLIALRRPSTEPPDPYRERVRVATRDLARKYRLTPTEADVVDLFVDGCARAELAARLGVTDNTMRSHVRSVCRKMDLPHLEHLFRVLLRECLGAAAAPFVSPLPRSRKHG